MLLSHKPVSGHLFRLWGRGFVARLPSPPRVLLNRRPLFFFSSISLSILFPSFFFLPCRGVFWLTPCSWTPLLSSPPHPRSLPPFSFSLPFSLGYPVSQLWIPILFSPCLTILICRCLYSQHEARRNESRVYWLDCRGGDEEQKDAEPIWFPNKPLGVGDASLHAPW